MSLNRSKISSKTRRNTETGIALISVLWALLLLSAFAASASFVARTRAIATHRELKLTQAQAVADAGIVAMISNLSDELVKRHPATNGTEQAWEFDGIKVAISISKEAGRIDLNKTDKNLLLAFLYSQAVDPGTAGTLVDQLRDRASSKSGLQAVEELRLIPSWRMQRLDCWMKAFTVYTGLAEASANEAPPAVLGALKLAQERRLGNREWLSSGVTSTANLMDGSLLGEVFRISAKASASDEVTVTSLWIGRLTGDRGHPMLTMRWDHADNPSPSACTQSSS